MPSTLCEQFAQILNSSIMNSKDNSCTVIRTRDNLKIEILGRPSTFGLTLAFAAKVAKAFRTLA